MLRAWLLALMLLLGGKPALAHPMPHSVVTLDVGEHAVTADVAIPLIELDLALGTSFSDDPAHSVPAASDRLAAYLLEHVRLATLDGLPWSVSIERLSAVSSKETGAGPYAELVADLALVPPAGATPRVFTLSYDAVMHRVVTHHALVSIRQDWLGGAVSENDKGARALGVIRVDTADSTVRPLIVDLPGGSYWQGFRAIVALGMAHIAEGTDHLLFLLTLLLPAPLLVIGSRWGGYAGARTSLISIGRIVTAFTVGHSLTLIVAAFFQTPVPQQPIEVAIALTILVSSVHALRPLYPHREPLIAALFGLVHGTAFSFTLAELDLSTRQLAVSLLGFNLGIELFQFGIVAMTLPCLLLFACSGVYAPVRLAGSVVAIVAACGWLADRLGVTSSVAGVLDTMGAHLRAAIALVTLVSVMTWLLRRRSVRLPVDKA